MRALRWVLAAQIVFFAVWGAFLLTSHRGAATVWLTTEPVDPRDLLAGHYVALQYTLTTSAMRLCEVAGVPEDSGAVFLRLQPSGEVVETVEGQVEISHATECRPEPPDSGGQAWIEGARGAGQAWRPFTFGIERFYVPDTSPLRDVRSGDVIVKIAINDSSQARVADLVQRLPLPSAGASGRPALPPR